MSNFKALQTNEIHSNKRSDFFEMKNNVLEMPNQLFHPPAFSMRFCSNFWVW